MNNLEYLTEQIAAFNPQYIYLFGSQAKGTATSSSDIDLCVIAPAENKRELLTELYYRIECEKPIDFLLYTPEEWENCILDKCSFAYKIHSEGVCIYG